MNETWLHFFALAAVVMVGLVLTPTRIKVRATVAAVAAIAVVLLAVFQPMFVLAVLNGALVAAVAIVLIVWIAWTLVRLQPWQAGKPVFAMASGTPPPTASPPATNAGATGSGDAVAPESPFSPSETPPASGKEASGGRKPPGDTGTEPPENPMGGTSEPLGGEPERGPQS